jgi:P4 family phage/plasmid primase-like protien
VNTPLLHVSIGSSCYDNQPVEHVMDFAALVALLTSSGHVGQLTLAEVEAHKAKDKQDPVVKADKNTRYFQFARFNGSRSNDNVISICGFTGDFDTGKISMDEVRAKLAGVAHLLYTTYSHSDEHPRFRLVVPYASPVTGDDHDRLFSWFNGPEMFNGQLDTAASDRSRLMYFPSCCADQIDASECLPSDGAYFDPISILATLPALSPAAAPAGKVAEADLPAGSAWVPRGAPADMVSFCASPPYKAGDPSNAAVYNGLTDELVGRWPANSGGGYDPSKVRMSLVNRLLRWTGGDAALTARLVRESPFGITNTGAKMDRHLAREIMEVRAEIEVSDHPPRKLAAMFGGGDLPADPLPRPPGVPAPPDVFTMVAAADGEPLPQARHLATDQRNAGRLIASYGKRLLSVGGVLYAWSGRHWEPDTALAHRFAGNLSRLVAEERDQVEAQLKELEKSLDPNGTKILTLKSIIKTLEMWGPECEMASRQNNAIKLLIKSVNVDADKLDADPLLINLENGTYNVRTEKLQPHNPLDYITKIAPVMFDATATCDRFDKFLIEVYNGDKELIDFVLRWFGYCSTGETIEHHVVIHWGDGANGKGTLINTIAAILGDYAGAGAPGLLTAKNADSRHPAEIADLFGKRMVTCSETDQDAPLREGFIKQASGADPLKGRFLYGQWFQFFPTHKLQAMTQHKPVVRGTDHGIWRRLLLIPYLNIFGTSKDIADGKANKLMDVDLGAVLKTEGPGILNRLLQGARDWLHKRLSPPAVVLAASETYRREQDRIGEFVREELTLDINGRTESKSLYGLYAGWDTGRTGAKPLGSKAFLAELEKHVPGFARKKLNGTRWIYGVTIGQSPAPA